MAGPVKVHSISGLIKFCFDGDVSYYGGHRFNDFSEVFQVVTEDEYLDTLDLALEWLNVKFARTFEDIKIDSLFHSPICHLNSSATFWEVFIWLLFE